MRKIKEHSCNDYRDWYIKEIGIKEGDVENLIRVCVYVSEHYQLIDSYKGCYLRVLNEMLEEFYYELEDRYTLEEVIDIVFGLTPLKYLCGFLMFPQEAGLNVNPNGLGKIKRAWEHVRGLKYV